ncbi:MAG: hypothetical protein Q7R95_07465 [bacterium]|nr:hypothetical protein [bacterium]
MTYRGVIIEESLVDNKILKKVTILKTRKEKVTPKHQTPWLKQWTLYTIQIPEININIVAEEISMDISTKPKHAWYVDFKNDRFHFIIFPHKVFKVDLQNPVLYKIAKEYGETLGIPSYQMQFERLKRS